MQPQKVSQAISAVSSMFMGMHQHAWQPCKSSGVPFATCYVDLTHFVLESRVPQMFQRTTPILQMALEAVFSSFG